MKILLVGLGGMGVCHYMNDQHIDNAQVVAVVGCTDSDRDRANEWSLPIYPNIAQACAAHEIDLVDICTPTFLHKQLALEALANQKHVIVEKPIALAYQDALEMYEAADRAGVQLYVAQVLQFTREVEALRGVVADQRYGRPLDACFERLSAKPQWIQGGWLFDKQKSGLLPFDLHIHDLDVIVSLFGKPDQVAYTRCQGDESDFAEHYRFHYAYKSGLNVSAEAAWFNACIPFTARWRVYFEHGMLICDQRGVTGYGADGNIVHFDVEDPIKVPCGVNLPDSGWFLRELSHLLKCAEKNEPSPLLPRQRILDVLEVLGSID